MRVSRVLAPFCLILALASCNKTVTEVVEKPIHDTVYTKGPALIRFISMVPEVSTVTLWRNAQKSGSPFGSALSSSTGQYYPIADSVPLTLYTTFTFNGSEQLDSITMPALAPYSMTTFALFLVGEAQSGHIALVAANDSAKLVPAPKGMSYIRFLNGLQDYPAPEAKLYLNVDRPAHSVFTVGSQPVPIFGGDMINYTPVPAGARFFTLSTPSGEEVDSLWTVLDTGAYYTARIQGRRTNLSSRFRIDPE